MTSTNPHSSDFSYRKYSLEQLDNWVHDALNCEDLTPQDIYDTIVKCVDDSVEYHKEHLTKSVELLSLLKGHRPVDFNDVMGEKKYYEGWDYTPTGEKFPNVSEATKKDWVDFWEETYYPDEYSKEQIRKFELKDRDYEVKRAKLDAEYTKELEEIRKNGGFEWTPGT
jgi:hypothetical protein